MRIPPDTLPKLHGPWLLLFRVVWLAAFLTTVASAICAPIIAARVDPAMRAYFALGLRPAGVIDTPRNLLAAPFGPEARAAGFRARDEIIAVAGHPTQQSADVLDIGKLLVAPEGASLAIRTRSADGRVRDIAVTHRAANIQLWFSGSGLDIERQALARSLVYDLMTLSLLVPAAIIFLRRPQDLLAAALSLVLVLLPIGPTHDGWAALGALGPYRFLTGAPLVIALMLGAAFPDGRYWPTWARWSLIAVPIFLIPPYFGFREFGIFGALATPGLLVVAALLALRYRRLLPGAERQQIRWVALGLSAAAVCFVVRMLLAEIYQPYADVSPATPWLFLAATALHATGYAVVGLALTVSLLKHRLYDAEALISRSAAVAVLTLLLGGVWAMSEKVIELALENGLGAQAGALAGAISAGLAAIAVASAQSRVRLWTEKRFQKGVYLLKQDIPGLMQAMGVWASAAEAGAVLAGRVSQDVRSVRAALVLETGEIAAAGDVAPANVSEWLTERPLAGALREREPHDPLFPLRIQLCESIDAEPVGHLLLGPRPDGSLCNRDELEALKEIVRPVARALHAITRRELKEAGLGSIIADQAERLAELEARLGTQEQAGRRLSI